MSVLHDSTPIIERLGWTLVHSVLQLALIALFGKKTRTTTSLGIAVFVIVLFSLGKYASWINRPFFDYFPFFNSFRAPEFSSSPT